MTWDDHEVENNYANKIPEKGQSVEAFVLRRAAAYQAYYEHMPLRISSLPNGPDMQLYRHFTYGNLIPSMCLIPASTGMTKPITTAISRLLMNHEIRIEPCLKRTGAVAFQQFEQLDRPLECVGAANFLCEMEFWDKRKPDLQHGFLGRLSGSARTGYQFH